MTLTWIVDPNPESFMTTCPQWKEVIQTQCQLEHAMSYRRNSRVISYSKNCLNGYFIVNFKPIETVGLECEKRLLSRKDANRVEKMLKETSMSTFFLPQFQLYVFVDFFIKKYLPLTHCCRETLKGVHRQTVETQIRRRIMRRLIRVSTVC